MNYEIPNGEGYFIQASPFSYLELLDQAREPLRAQADWHSRQGEVHFERAMSNLAEAETSIDECKSAGFVAHMLGFGSTHEEYEECTRKAEAHKDQMGVHHNQGQELRREACRLAGMGHLWSGNISYGAKLVQLQQNR